MFKSKHNNGFTLIELMLIVVMIGVLTAIAVPNFIFMQRRAKEADVKGICHTVQLAAEDYAVRHDGVYPERLANLQHLLPGERLLENPFTGNLTEPNDGQATIQGQVGSQPVWNKTETAVIGYVITGYGYDVNSGENGIIVKLTDNP